MNRAKSRIAWMLMVVMLSVTALLLLALRYWQYHIESVLVANTFRSQLLQVNSLVSEHALTDDKQISHQFNHVLINAGIRKIALFDSDGHVLQSAPAAIGLQEIVPVFPDWKNVFDHNRPRLDTQPISLRNGAAVHMMQRVHVPVENSPGDIALYVELDVALLLGNVQPVWQQFLWWGLLGLLLVFFLARWFVQTAVLNPLLRYSQSINEFIENPDQNRQPDLQTFAELHGMEKTIVRLVNNLRVKSNALNEQGQYIQEKLDELDRVIRCAGIGTWDWNVVSGEMRFNVAWAQMLGLPDAAVEGSVGSWLDRTHPADRDVIERALQRHFERRANNYRCEYRIRHDDGHWLWVLDSGEVYERDSCDKPLKAAGIHLDISARKQLELEVNQSAAQLLAVFNQTYSGIAIFDQKSQKLLSCNEQFAKLYGQAIPDLIGKSFGDITRSPENPLCPSFATAQYSVIAWHDTEWESEYTLVNGALIWLHLTVSVTAIDNDDGVAIVIVQSIQDRKQIEHTRELQHAVIEQSQLRFDTMLSSMQEGVVLQTPDGQFVEFNDMAPHLLGLSFDEMSGVSSFDSRWHCITRNGDVMTAEQHPPIVCARTGLPQNNVVMGVRNLSSGKIVWLNVNSQPVISTDGEVTYMVTTFADITERLENEDKLQETSACLKAIMDHAPDVILGVDETQTIRYASAAAKNIFQYETSELIGKSIRILLPPHLGGIHQTWAQSYLANGATDRAYPMGVRRIIQGRTKNGTLVDIEISLSRTVTPQGPLVTAVIRDTTERRQLEAHAARMSHALEQSPIKSILFDLDGIIEYVNAACFSQGGYTPSELRGRNVFELYSPLTDKAQLKSLVDSLMQRKTWQGQLSFIHRDGAVSVDRTTIAPLRDVEGNVTHFISMQEDISEQIRINRELDEYRSGLEKMVISRTIELTDAKQRAEAATLAKSSFLANMSHEIRTPMNAITGFAQLLRQEELTKKQADYVHKIVFAAEHLLHIINDILDLSKIEAGKVSLQVDAFELKRFAQEMLDMVRTRAEVKNLQLKMRIDGDVPLSIKCDRMRLGQVLLNLLSNATKFTDRGEIELHFAQPRENCLRVEICDTGIGINAEQQARLFQAFEQADVSTTRRYGGTGLGLSICRNLVQLMGGEIGLSSVVGEGSRFWIELPFVPVNVEHTRLEAKPLPPKPPGRRQYPNARVLLVEDDKLNQELVLILLAEHGIQVTVANDGVEALGYARQHDFDIILMDIQMPLMDGIECAQAVRSSSRNRHTPIIALTANVFDDERQRYERAGIGHVLAKPLDVVQLEALLERIWGDAPVDAGLAPVPTQSSVLLKQMNDAEVSPSDHALLLQKLKMSGEFDIEKALTNVGQRSDLLCSLCKGFAASHADTLASIRAALIAEEREQAARLSHSLKGAALAIAAKPLAEAAADLEKSIRQSAGDIELQQTLMALQDRVGRVLAVLQPATVPEMVSVAIPEQ